MVQQSGADEVAVEVAVFHRFGIADENADTHAAHFLDVLGVREEVFAFQQFAIEHYIHWAEFRNTAESVCDARFCFLSSENQRRSGFRVSGLLVADFYRFLSQKSIGGNGRGLAAAAHHYAGVQEREQAHAGRVLGALDGFIPARRAQVEQLVEVVDAGSVVREGDEGGCLGGFRAGGDGDQGRAGATSILEQLDEDLASVICEEPPSLAENPGAHMRLNGLHGELLVVCE